MPRPRNDDLSNLQKAQQAIEAGNAASGQAFALGGAPPPTRAIEQAIGDQYPQTIEDIYHQFPEANPSFSLPEEASNFNLIGTANAAESNDLFATLRKVEQEDPNNPSPPERVTGLDALQEAHDRIVGPVSVESLGQKFNAPPQMLSTLRENAPEAGAIIGGTAGTAIGTALGTPLGPLGQVPLAMTGGAIGSAMGTSIGHTIKGDEPLPGELATSALLGSVPLGLMNASRFVVRMFGGIPSIRASTKLANADIARAEAEGAYGVIRNFVNRQAAGISRGLNKVADEARVIREAPFLDKNGKPLVGMARDAVERSRNARVATSIGTAMENATNRFGKFIPKEMKAQFTDPKIASKRALEVARIPEYKTYPGSASAAAAFVLSGGNIAATGIAGIFSYVMSKMTKPVLQRLASESPAFHNWAIGINPRDPLAQGAFTFITQVLANAKTEQDVKDANEFYNHMMDYIEQNPQQAFEPSEPTGENK